MSSRASCSVPRSPRPAIGPSACGGRRASKCSVTASSTEQYVFCRILAAILNEAGLAFSQGVAGADDIDTAMTKGTNYPKGPLAWADEIGHNTVRGVLKALNEQTGNGRYEAAPLFSV